jgi:hypothetical protein
LNYSIPENKILLLLLLAVLRDELLIDAQPGDFLCIQEAGWKQEKSLAELGYLKLQKMIE